MGVLKALLRFFSYLFHGVLTLALIAISVVTLASGAGNLQFGMLPWTGSTLTYILLFGSIAGFLTVVLAIRGTLRPLFFLWALAVAVLLVRGYVFSGYHFSPGEFRSALYLVLASLVALIGAWVQMWRQAERKRDY